MTDLPTLLFLVCLVFCAALEQTISGFGFALIVMPLATLILGIKTAAPLVALTGLTLYTINLLRYRQAINLHEIVRLGVAAALGVPLGVWGLVNLPESLIKSLLGFILIAYALFNFARPVTRQILSLRWGYLAGLVTGCLGGAYNTPGPPLIVYGTLRHWQREEFRAILQTLFFLTGALTVTSHWFAQLVTPTILTMYLLIVPALVAGIVIGARLDRRIDHATFRRIVVGMIFVLGLSLVIGGR